MTPEPTTSTEAREWLERSRNSKSPSIAKLHATTLLAALDRLEARVEVELDLRKAAYGRIEELEGALLRFDLDCMHLHEEAMSDPFGCEAFVQNRIREILTRSEPTTKEDK